MYDKSWNSIFFVLQILMYWCLEIVVHVASLISVFQRVTLRENWKLNGVKNQWRYNLQCCHKWLQDCTVYNGVQIRIHRYQMLPSTLQTVWFIPSIMYSILNKNKPVSELIHKHTWTLILISCLGSYCSV